MRRWMNMVSLAAVLGAQLVLPQDAFAAATCFCSLACQDNTNYKGTPVKGWLWDSEALATYTGLNQQGDKNQTDCNTRCTRKCSTTWSKANAGPQACSKGCANGAPVLCWSKVGTREWKSAHGVGTVTRTPAQVTYKCPAGTKNAEWVDGGAIAAGRKCTFVACDHYPTFPPKTYPPNGTPIGSWGFAWGEFIGQHVDPVATTVQAASCGIP